MLSWDMAPYRSAIEKQQPLKVEKAKPRPYDVAKPGFFYKYWRAAVTWFD